MVSNLAYWCVAVVGAAGWGAFAHACFMLQKLEQRIRDLLNMPLSFWRHREMMRTLAESVSLKAFSQPRKIAEPVDDKVVKFRRPPPFGPSVDVPFQGKVK